MSETASGSGGRPPWLQAMIGMVRSPSQTLEEVAASPSRYMGGAVAIFVITAALIIGTDNFDWTDDEFGGLGYFGGAEYAAATIVIGIVVSMAFVVMVYLLGGRHGGFGRTFAVMAYPSVPVLIGAPVALAILGGFVAAMPGLEDAGSADEIIGAALAGFAAYVGIYATIGIWSLILTIKAIRAANHVGTMRAIGVFVVSVMGTMAVGMVVGMAVMIPLAASIY